MVIPFGEVRPTLGAGVWIAPTAVVTGDVVIGERSSIWFGTVVRGDESPIRIGRETNVQDTCVLHTGAESGSAWGTWSSFTGARFGRVL